MALKKVPEPKSEEELRIISLTPFLSKDEDRNMGERITKQLMQEMLSRTGTLSMLMISPWQKQSNSKVYYLWKIILD